MKKRYFFSLLLLLSITFSAEAQYYGGSICFDCETSIEIGAASSDISGMGDTSRKTGFYIGLYQYKPFSESFALRFGTSYTNLGTKIKEFDQPLITHTISFPASFHYIYRYKFQGFVGGDFNFNISSKIPDEEGNTVSAFGLSDKISFFDASIFVGGGIIVANNIDINLKYHLGVTNLNAGDESDSKLKKNWMTLSVGYTFR